MPCGAGAVSATVPQRTLLCTVRCGTIRRGRVARISLEEERERVREVGSEAVCETAMGVAYWWRGGR